MWSIISDNLTAFLATWVALTLVFGLFYKWWRKPHRNFPPGPRGVPLLGVLPYFGENPEQTMRKWSEEKFGPVMSIRMGLEDVVVLNSFDVIMQAYVKQGSQFSGRPSSGAFQLLGMDNGGLSFKIYNSDYKHQKKFALKAFRDFGVGKSTVDDMVNEEADIFNEFLKSKEGQLIDLKGYFYTLTSNVISRLICGQRYEYDDPEMVGLLSALKKVFADPKVGLVDMFPMLKSLPVFSDSVKEFIDSEHHVLSIVKKHWKRHKDLFDPNHLKDFMDLFRYEQKFGTREERSGFTDLQMHWLGTDFFVAGAETTSTQLAWCLHLYLYYPEHQAALEEEIANVFGSGGEVTQAHRPQTPFLNAYIQEVFRFRTTVPLVLKHTSLCHAKLQGFDIPKGTTLIPNFHAVHMDSSIWPEPEKFNPYRHIDEDGNFVFSSKIIPFSIGPRSCPGEALARVETYIFFAKLLQKYKILPSDQPPHIDGITSVVYYPKPYQFRIEQR